MAKPKKTTQLKTDFWEDTINLRNCTLGFECKQDWYRLLETKDENVKYCKQCEMSSLYEDKIKNMGNAGRNGGEYYTPRPLIKTIVKLTSKYGSKVLSPERSKTN